MKQHSTRKQAKSAERGKTRSLKKLTGQLTIGIDPGNCCRRSGIEASQRKWT